MTGKSILEALSFVDEAYIEEAETGKLPAVFPVKKLLPLAACLGVALTGLYFADFSAAGENASDMENLQVYQEIAVENQNKVGNALCDESEVVTDQEQQPYVSEVPSIIVRIESWEENGFTATVARHVDSEAIPIGQTVRVEFMPEADPEPEEAYPVGTLVQVRCASIDAQTGVILAEAVSPAGEE